MSGNFIKKIIFFLSLFSSSIVASSPISDGNYPIDYSEDAMILKAIFDEDNGNLSESERLYSQLYQITGKKEYLIQGAKDVLVQKSDPTHIIDNIIDWIKKHPSSRDPELFRTLVALYIQQGSLNDAEDVADEYLLDSPSIDDKLAVAALKYELGKTMEAKKILENIYKETGDQKAMLQLVDLLEKKTDNDNEALKILKEYISKHRDASVGVYFRLIEIYARKKDIDNVLDIYKKLYQKDPQKYFLQKIIEAYIYKKDEEGAVAFLEKSGADDKLLFKFYKKLDRIDDAIKLAKKLYHKTQNPNWLAEEGILIYDNAKKNKKLNIKTLKDMQVLFDKAIKNGMDDPLYLNYYGYVLIDEDLDIDKGIKLVKMALEVYPKNAYYLDSLAWGLYKKGECKRAYKIMKKFFIPAKFPENEIRTHWEAIKKCNSSNL